MSFTWIPLYSEIAREVLRFRDRQDELLSLLSKMKTEGLIGITIADRDVNDNEIPLTEIDPFTFFSFFNRTVQEKRLRILANIKKAWQLRAPLPEDFDGIPLANAQNSWAFAFKKLRKPSDIPTLWRAAQEGIQEGWRTFDRTLFDETLAVRQMGLAKLTICLFWLNPTGFLSCDKYTKGFTSKHGIYCERKSASDYFAWLEKVVATIGEDFPRISLDAFEAGRLDAEEMETGKGEKAVVDPTPNFMSRRVSYWWLNANPRIWNFADAPVGERETYTAYSEKGHKRQKYKYFQEVQPGDFLLGYVTSPQKEVVAICRITKGLHRAEQGETIEFEKIEQLARPIGYETLQAIPDLAACEPLVNNQGSLFKVTEPEYEIIRSLIDEAELPLTMPVERYDKRRALRDLFLAEAQFDKMLLALKEKKNVVLQGAPGVGKTYVAKRLAYTLLEAMDPQRVEMIQFHQSYSYEDFVQGFRPTPKGHFDLKCGVFYRFCRRAQRDEAQQIPYVFIIDEINRGNLSKILGELMVLIEPDKRGKEHAVPLAYSQDADDLFHIPENLYLIGTMNTADRSLAMVDYALRRRFRFITLVPEFASDAFRRFLLAAGMEGALISKIVNRMTALNEAIAADVKNLGPGFQIGHSYFCPRNGVKADNEWYHRVIEAEIVPLIQEYWFDNEQAVLERRDTLLA